MLKNLYNDWQRAIARMNRSNDKLRDALEVLKTVEGTARQEADDAIRFVTLRFEKEKAKADDIIRLATLRFEEEKAKAERDAANKVASAKHEEDKAFREARNASVAHLEAREAWEKFKRAKEDAAAAKPEKERSVAQILAELKRNRPNVLDSGNNEGILNIDKQ